MEIAVAKMASFGCIRNEFAVPAAESVKGQGRTGLQKLILGG